MRDWRSTIFWLVLALVGVELCFVISIYLRDGKTARPVAAASAPPSPVVSDLALAASPDPAAPADPSPLPPAAAPDSPSPVTPTDPPSAVPSLVASPAPTSPSPTAAPSAAPSATPSSVASASPTPRPAPSPVHVRSRVVMADASAFAYAGRWEHIADTWDGRLRGKSSRAFKRGSSATFTFHGRFVRLYGVVGPGGGFGAVTIDGRPVEVVDFFSASKGAHRLVFRSGTLARGMHRLTVAVVPDPKISGARTQYVNIDAAEYGT